MLPLLALVTLAVPSTAQRCFDAAHAPCTATALADPQKRQLVFFSTGFAADEQEAFFSELHLMIDELVTDLVSNVWSRRYASQLLFIGHFSASGPIGSGARFDAKVVPQPSRGKALTLSLEAVYDEVARRNLRPSGVLVLFNYFFPKTDDVIGNAAPPSFTRRGYGVAKMSRQELVRTPRRLTHEMAHATMSFLDEYIEHGLDEVSIRSLDVLTPLLLAGDDWSSTVRAVSDLGAVYDYDFSEVLADNGADNVTLSRHPSTVTTPGYAAETYDYEHGMFFGRGVFHMRGKNLMNTDRNARGADDGFALDHSAAQLRTIATAFDRTPRRPNDRLRAAGPRDNWPFAFGTTTRVLMKDADKLHTFQPTTRYDVQVGWHERVWRTCWTGIFPFPCYDEVWRTAEKSLAPTPLSMNVKASAALGLGTLTQKVLCGLGVDEIASDDGVFHLCLADLSSLASTLLPTLSFQLPYQETSVPAQQWMTTYYWRFRTHNAAITSGWTGWSRFYRSL